MALHDDVYDALQAAGKHFENHLTRHLQNEAIEAGWDREAARKIRARHSGGYVDIDVSDAEDWEYGTESRPPLAVGRQTLNHIEDHQHVFEDALMHALRGVL